MISDRLVSHPIVDRKTVFSGMVWDVRHDAFELNGETVERDYIVHPGAVAIIALNDSGELLLIEQYRHAQGKIMWEAPAGLMDLANEDPLETAKRELFEETGYVAQTWNVLLDLANTPGGSSEQIRIYFAQGLSLHPDGRPTGDAARGHPGQPQSILGPAGHSRVHQDPVGEDPGRRAGPSRSIDRKSVV